MALLDDIETRLDQYGVARTVGSQTTSTGCSDTFTSTEAAPAALSAHAMDSGGAWNVFSTTWELSTTLNRLFLNSTVDLSGGSTAEHWAWSSTAQIGDYFTVQVDCYRPAAGGQAGDLVGVALWLTTGPVGGEPSGMVNLAFRLTSTSVASLELWETNSTVGNPQTVASGLVLTDTGLRLVVDVAGLTIRPWHYPSGGTSGSATVYAPLYLSTDPRNLSALGTQAGVVGRCGGLQSGTSQAATWDNFSVQPYSSDPLWFVTKSYMPPDGDRVIALYETGGGAPEPKAEVNYPTFQVRARAGTTGYSTAAEKLAAVQTALHGFTGTLSSWYYPGIWAQSDVLPIGFDPQDTRPVLAQNYRAARSRTS